MVTSADLLREAKCYLGVSEGRENGSIARLARYSRRWSDQPCSRDSSEHSPLGLWANARLV